MDDATCAKCTMDKPKEPDMKVRSFRLIQSYKLALQKQELVSEKPEEKLPSKVCAYCTLNTGRNTLHVTCINAAGSLIFSL